MPKKKASQLVVPVIEESIHVIRGQRVMLDADLASLYEVTTGNFNKAVQRNIKRFPKEFMFQLNKQEFTNLIFQIGTSRKWGGRRKMPYAFTEHGALMAANILRSERAEAMSVYVIRAFLKLREIVAHNHKLAAKLTELEKQVQKHDKALVSVVHAIQQLIEEPKPKKKRSMGFISDN